jgi:hypothetical protein
MQVKLPIGIRLAPSPAAARGSLALEPAATSACVRAWPGRRWAVFTPQAAGLRIGIGLLAAGKFSEPFELLEIKLSLVQVWLQFRE